MSGLVDVLIPTRNRTAALCATLTALAAQTHGPLHIVVSDQSDEPGSIEQGEVLGVLRFLHAQGHTTRTLRHLPRRGMAEQRAFLLAQSCAPYCLFLDDDVLLEPTLVDHLLATLTAQGCGFVGSAVHGLSHLGRRRPAEQAIAFWDGPVQPETVACHGVEWARHHLHSAANLYHLQQELGLDSTVVRPYRIAWVGGCVLFDRAKLLAAGGFDFWHALPREHCGEDVLAQLRVMARFGGCGIIPSGAYHMELPTTVPNREVDAPRVLWQVASEGAIHE